MKIFKKIQSIKIIIAIILILIGIGFRFLPHSPNFSPIAAIAIFAGFYFSKKIAFTLPLLIMIISDVFIGYYGISIMLAVYGSFLFCVVLGFWVKKNRKWYTIGGGAILGAIIFFVVTNLAVWLFTPWYVKDLSGLTYCYFLALPFFKNTLLSNLFYVSVFFSVYEGAKYLVRKRYEIVLLDGLGHINKEH